ncbi:replication factor C subunit 5 [Caerostris extrusa]|uniref:Replication factor C subunit 5 n=1 Tax=Caerostris extrusa TaxID=172846 RepID=A0AAV4Y9Z0_CAEEX|nr:replication factor C subunit 5 [Caerostris extrusa]
MSNTLVTHNLPWVEKYRPEKLDDLIAHEDIIRTINKFIKEDKLPHLLFYGPPGTGKTSTILACAKQIYSPAEFSSMVLELNASDDRGIELRVIEKFTENTRFCLICNYLSKITPAIQSRCTRFRFGPLSNKQILPRLEHVIEKKSKLAVTEDGRKALMDLAQGDMRKVINVLQCAALAFDTVNEENVYACVGHPLKSDVQKIVNWLLNDDFVAAYKNINELKIMKGLALQDILTQVHLFVHRIELPDDVKIHLLVKMADIEDHLASGTSEKIQLSALISAFQVARDMVQ